MNTQVDTTNLKIVFHEGLFKCHCHFEERFIPREAGFLWDPVSKIWYTKSHGVAAKLDQYLDDTARNEIRKKRLYIETWAGSLSVPKREKLYPFQESAALFALSRNRSYLALDPGLGKTPIAAVVAKTLNDHSPHLIFYICPPFLVGNTIYELSKWAHGTETYIVPDSMIHKNQTRNWIQAEASEALNKNIPSLLIVDEAHRFKNDEAGRTKALFGNKTQKGIASFFDRVIYLSGTPMPNRPIELYPILKHSASEVIDNMTKHEYAEKYCSAFRSRWGWDYSGASNIEELVSRVTDKFMIRFKKDELDLPEKTEEMIVLDSDLPPKLVKTGAKILALYCAEDLMKHQIKLNLGKESGEELHLSTYRKELGIVKVKAASEYINYILEETSDNVLVFAIHKEVIKELDERLGYFSPLTITGSTPMALRDAYVKAFQTDPQRRLFIGNIQAAGIGLTLTKATRVVFVEFSWVPSDNSQASDRAHRIGQKNNVLVQYLVHANSIDQAVIETVLRKQNVVGKL